MRALSVMQPWAQLLVIGAKQFETRSWHTTYRGPILIHASRRFMEPARLLMTLEPFHSALKAHGYKYSTDLPVGCIVGTVILDDCLDSQDAIETISEQEKQFGDFRPGRWAWKLSNPSLLASPIRYQGKLGLFEIPDEVVQKALEPVAA